MGYSEAQLGLDVVGRCFELGPELLRPYVAAARKAGLARKAKAKQQARAAPSQAGPTGVQGTQGTELGSTQHAASPGLGVPERSLELLREQVVLEVGC